ncbi:phosphomannomutase [Dinoroseobacter sp. S124A]|uniref:phosphomannomutase n=1 Tax=Dinoroseobacter sp. S124A TaxID=3415128 RepID=UPI003C7C6ECE
MGRLKCFKAYDIRGQVGEDLTEAFAYGLGRAAAAELSAAQVVIGRDVRASSPALSEALARGLQSAGCGVLDLGLCGTEEVYFATDHYRAQGGIIVTASHNPIGDNGFKLVGAGAAPLPEAQFRAIEARLAEGTGRAASAPGSYRAVDCRAAYVARVLSFVEPATLAPLHLFANGGHGAAGPTLDAVVAGLEAQGAPLRVTRGHHAPDPAFPAGIPNPMLPENQPLTGAPTRAAGADLGVAWDGDFDRCFFFDHTGAFVPGEYVVAVLAQAMLARTPRARIVHDARVAWNTQRVVRTAGGVPVMGQTGHALMKALMRAQGAVYGGELSAHHYFRDFMYCDSGMIPWLLMLAQISASGQSLQQSCAEMRARHPSSGEINFRVADADRAVAEVLARLGPDAVGIDQTDGLSLSFAEWRANLRRSNTEALLRLNVEARDDADLVAAQVARITEILRPFAAQDAAQ